MTLFTRVATILMKLIEVFELAATLAQDSVAANGVVDLCTTASAVDWAETRTLVSLRSKSEPAVS